ncbi:hypothetical protein ACOSOMT5_P2084 [Acidiphilium sp. MT5]
MATRTNPLALPLADRLTVILTMLRKIIGDQGPALRINPALNLLIWKRVGYFIRRFRQIATNPPKPRPPRPNRSPSASKPQADPSLLKLPTRHAWLPRLFPGHLVPCARGQFQTFLTEPDMTALIAETPQLGRILRPLCHMLGIPLPDNLRRPKIPRPKSFSPPRPRRPRIKKPAPPEPTLYEYFLAKYPPPVRPMLPGHLYKPLNPNKYRA